jgi:hypothetical protein
MKTLYEVHGNHPVAKRIDEYRLTEVDKNDIVAELDEAGYDDVHVDSHEYYEDGDEIVITHDTYMAKMGNDDEAYRLIGYILEQKAKNHNVSILKRVLFPLKAKLKALRLDRTMGQLVAEWGIGEDKDGCDPWKTTNVYHLEKLGLKFIHPEFDEIPLMNADDKWLTERELVVKTYALQNGLPEKEAEFLVSIVESAMGKHGIVFYRP